VRNYALQFTGGINTASGTFVGGVDVEAGATFQPALNANSPGTTTNVGGPLTLAAGSTYQVRVTPTASDSVTATTAALHSATAIAVFTGGSYISKQYTIVTATSGITGTFGTLVNTNMPVNISDALSYDATHAYLDLTLNFSPPVPPSAPTPGGFSVPGGLNGNQQNVANALVHFFNASGGIPAVFANLGPAGLTQASGETATASQQSTFDAMNLFIDTMLDPFNRAPASSLGGGVNSYAADSDASAYAANGRPRSDAERNAYAMFTKAPPAVYEPRWSTWIAGFGGSQFTDGNAAAGSGNATSSIYGTAVGADYRFSPNTTAGFALAGGGTNFSVANSGSGHSDLFQAGAFVRHEIGAVYVTATLAYGWQDITTNRTVAGAGVDQLRAEFDANTFSGRLEGGYRLVSPWMGVGITPYAAAQFTTFDLPAYAETAISGSSAFVLSYGARDVTDPRSELGFRSDKSFAMAAGILTLRSRFAWAYDFDPNRSIAATFQSLPGASFVVDGAAQAHNSALTTASAEWQWSKGWSIAATFEGEFSDVTSSYAGKGVLRYTW
jgi:uncharacterized protein with beta-barrel porin domain